MSEFKVIETQEQLDGIIGDRLRRQQETMEKKFADYLSPDDFKSKTEDLENKVSELGKMLEQANAEISAFNSTLEEKDATIKKYETDSVKRRILASLDMPFELADRIAGETEEDIRKDAEALQKFVGKVATPVPMYNNDKKGTENTTDAAFKAMLHELKGE